MRTNRTQIKGTLQAWSDSLNLDPSTLKKKLNKAAIKFEAGKLLGAIQVFRALTLQSEKELVLIRKLTAEAVQTETENRLRDGELVTRAVAEDLFWMQLLLPLKQSLELMPEQLAPLANPDKPETAQSALRAWVEQMKRDIGDRKP